LNVGRDLAFLAIGVAIGLLTANLAQRVIEHKHEEYPEAIQDKISDRLASLEQQYSRA